MFKTRFVVYILTLCFLASPKVNAQSLLENGKIPKDLVVTLERTVCFGSCPDYKLTIKSNGKITFNGVRFTATEGIADGEITQADLKKLVSAFERSHFFTLKSSYVEKSDGCREVWTDNPSETVSIRINGKKKAVSHYFGCRKVAGNVLQRIIDLGKEIDKVTDSKQWVETKTSGIPKTKL